MTSTTSAPEGDSHGIVAELSEFLRIPSVSTLPEHKADIALAATWLATYLRDAGLDSVRVIPTAGHPLVYAEWLRAAGQPTVLIYGHYDVQPADPLDAWQSPPFAPTVRGDNIYARGAADDKGQVYIHLRAVRDLLSADGHLPVNVRFLIEGEEEVGGEGIEHYVKTEGASLACDAVLISDSPMYAPGQPTICTGLRGALFAELTVQTGAHDLHSGLYGGAAPNAVNMLCQIAARLLDDRGRVAIPGYYDAVRPLSSEERAAWARLPFDVEAYRRDEVQAPALLDDPEFSVLERVWGHPTLDLNGISGGFTGAGSKAIIPARATAKVSMRLVPDQNPQAIARALEAYIGALCPPGADATLRVLGTSAPVLVPPDSPIVAAAGQALHEVFGVAPVYTRLGGSIPIVGLFMQVLGAPCVMLGFGLPDDNLHAPNEKMYLPNITSGIAVAKAFLHRLHR